MNKMKYQAGGAVDSTDAISPKKIKEMLQRQKEKDMDANMQKGMENYNKRRVGGQAAKDEAAAKKAAAKKAAAKKAAMAAKPKPTGMRTNKQFKDYQDNYMTPDLLREWTESDFPPDAKKTGGMVGYKKGGKVEKKKAGGRVGYKKGGKVRGCGIATQGVRKAKGSY